MKNLPKEFSLKHWRRIYDKIHKMGAHLQKCLKDKTLSEGEEEYLISEIKIMSDNLSLYMDRSGLHMPAPLWFYRREDQRTWISSESFIYQDRCK
jgi:hypothetical protein